MFRHICAIFMHQIICTFSITPQCAHCCWDRTDDITSWLIVHTLEQTKVTLVNRVKTQDSPLRFKPATASNRISCWLVFADTSSLQTHTHKNTFRNYTRQAILELIPVPEIPKARICGLSHPVIAGSNPSGSMDVCLLWVSCLVR